MTDAPVRFIRKEGMRALPVPVAGGSIQTLQKYLNLKDQGDFVLCVSWVLAAMRPFGPYTILAVTGEAGTAKSTLVTATHPGGPSRTGSAAATAGRTRPPRRD